MPKTHMKKTSANYPAKSPPWPKPSRSLKPYKPETKSTSMLVMTPLMKMIMVTMPISPTKTKSNTKPKAIVMMTQVKDMNMFPQLKSPKMKVMIPMILMILMTLVIPMIPMTPVIPMIPMTLMMMKMMNHLKMTKNYSLKCTPT